MWIFSNYKYRLNVLTSSENFEGFLKETFKFFSSLEKNNNSMWFNKNRDSYQNLLVQPSRKYVVSIAEFFNHLNPAIRTEPKFNQTLMRISKNMRFAKGEPYKNYFLIHFGRFKMDSEFYVYLDKTGISCGIFLNNTDGENLYFSQNLSQNKSFLIETFKNYELNNKFRFAEIGKEITTIRVKFDIDKHFDKFNKTKYIILEKDLPKERKVIYSPDFTTLTVKLFSRLYPIYCFAISPEPEKLLIEFEEKMGVAK
jgi:uncharacterized protein (DUF2461 family)